MTTSVPSVHPIEDLKWRIADLMELAANAYRITGDIEGIDQTVKLARDLCQEMKVLGNMGKMDWGYINKCDAVIGRIEVFVQRVKTVQRDAANAESAKD